MYYIEETIECGETDAIINILDNGETRWLSHFLRLVNILRNGLKVSRSLYTFNQTAERRGG